MHFDLRHWAERDPHRVAVQVADLRLTYGELEALANRLARLFDSLGLRRGDHIATILPNVPLALAIAWAAWRSGLYYTPVASTLTARDAAYIVGNSQARLVVADSAVQTPVAELPALCGGVANWFWHGQPIPGFAALHDAVADQSSSPRSFEPPGALMVYTSGTTGAPKGVWRPLPSADLRATPSFAADLIRIFALDEHVRYLSTAPLYHAAPLRTSLAVTAVGGSVVGMPRFDAAHALRLLSDERISHSQWVPAMFQRLLKLPDTVRRGFTAPLHRMALHAAAPCPIPLKQAMLDWWGPVLVEYYSGSEGVGFTSIDSHEWQRRPGSVGRAVKGVPHVLDEECRELGPGETGRIFFSGVVPFQYFGEPAKTAQRTSPQGYQTLGDIGHVDAEGYLYLTDRMDDMILSGGVNLYPQEIESALLEIEGVADAGVVGAADELFGERPVAFIVADAGYDVQVLRHDLPTQCDARLGRIKSPTQFLFLDRLPRSPTGKLLRRELRELLRATRSPGVG